MATFILWQPGVRRSLSGGDVHHLLTFSPYPGRMPQFDANITIGPHHLTNAGLDPRTQSETVADAVRAAVGKIPGAAWIDVAVEDFLPSIRTWVNVYPVGFARTPNTPQWRQLRDTVEETTRAALVAASAPV